RPDAGGRAVQTFVALAGDQLRQPEALRAEQTQPDLRRASGHPLQIAADAAVSGHCQDQTVSVRTGDPRAVGSFRFAVRTVARRGAVSARLQRNLEPRARQYLLETA